MCADPIFLNNTDGNVLRRVCTFKTIKIRYSLFRIDSGAVEKAFLDYLGSVGTDWDQAFWINGEAQDDGTWQLVECRSQRTIPFHDYHGDYRGLPWLQQESGFQI